MGERSDNPNGDVSWTSMFDPAANADALGQIQRRGLRAASEIVERLVRTVDGDRHGVRAAAPGLDAAGSPAAGGGGGAPLGSPTSEEQPESPGSDTAPASDLIRVWGELLQRALCAVAGTAPRNGFLSPAAGPAPIADLGRGNSTGTVHVRAVAVRAPDLAPGAPADECHNRYLGGDAHDDERTTADAHSGSAEVWLHNGTDAPISGLRLHCGDLRAHDGAILPATAIRFDPPSLDELPARSSRGVVVEVLLGSGVAPGTYRGVVLVAGAPDVWLPIDIVVGGGGG